MGFKIFLKSNSLLLCIKGGIKYNFPWSKLSSIGHISFIMCLQPGGKMSRISSILFIKFQTFKNINIKHQEYCYTESPCSVPVPFHSTRTTQGILRFNKSQENEAWPAMRSCNEVEAKHGGPGGVRTHDRQLKRLLLYRLSYRPRKIRNTSERQCNNGIDSCEEKI